MNLYENVVKFFGQKKNGENVVAPESVCPNCWGSQEYADQIREIEKDFQLEVSKGSANYAFIQNFVVNHIDGIKLRNSLEGFECAKCKIVYPKDK
jgi:hypothetical protein